MKRILLLIKGLGRGGAEHLLLNAAPYLARSEFEYEVAYLLPHKNALVSELKDAGFPVWCLEGARGVGWVGRLRTLARKRGIDLLHIHSPVPAVGARLGLSSRRGPRIVYTEHYVWGDYHPATNWGNLLTFGRNDHVFAVSNYVLASLRYPKPFDVLRMPPVETLYHGLDHSAVASWACRDGVRDELGIPADAPVVGNVAHFRSNKRHDLILQAALQVRRSVPQARFVLVGLGPMEMEIRRQARALGLREEVIFTGYREDARRVMSSFDVFVMPSDREGLPIALLEAMALRKPAVITRAGGLDEVVEHDKNGLVVPPNDAQSLAEAIVRLFEDPHLRGRLGQEASRRAGDFDIRKAVRREEEVYRELLS